MKVTAIIGTNKKGVTNRLTQEFLAGLESPQVRTFHLPTDGPDFCTGCVRCILKNEDACPHAKRMQPIAQTLLDADLLVFSSPTYVWHTTGAMKVLLDHFAYRWMPHRPAPEMFGKRAVIITQAAGQGQKRAASDIKDSLAWWGISDIAVFSCALMEEIEWEKLSDKRRTSITQSLQKLANRYNGPHRPPRVSLNTRIKFGICRQIQRVRYKGNPADSDPAWWHEHGWLGKSRPWK